MPFKVKSKKYLGEMEVGEIVDESDYAGMCPKTGLFVQMEYFQDDRPKQLVTVKPGIWTIVKTMSGLELTDTTFVTDVLLDSLVNTQETSDKINKFFSRLHVYAEEGIEVPKRGVLLYGSAGTGKSSIISRVCREHAQDGKTAIVLWSTDKFEAGDIKSFIKGFSYDGVDKFILVVEDIGGVEVDQVRMRSDSSLLALLDNQEKTFTIPTLILATTNFPEIFMGNLTNRPSRFDDKIHVGVPGPDQREALLKFFTKDAADQASIDFIKSKKCNDFTPAHIKEARIRSRIYDIPLEETLKQIAAEIELYKKSFEEKKLDKMGF